MCSEDIFIAGRYNKYVRDLSQSPWIDKADKRIKDSVQELIEEGLKQHLQYGRAVFSSSGREDVDVRMLGKGRPFVFRIVNPWDPDSYTSVKMALIQTHINSKNKGRIEVRDLQVVSNDEVTKNIKDGQETKTKEYRALCCSSRPLTLEDMEKISTIRDLDIHQKTPIRVLHRRSLASRCRRIHSLKVDGAKTQDFSHDMSPEESERIFVLTLLTEAGTYIKEFVHGDFGRTLPNLSSLIPDCDTDLIELDVTVSIARFSRKDISLC